MFNSKQELKEYIRSKVRSVLSEADRWNEETLSQEAAKYSTRREFQTKNPSAYVSAWRKGLLDKLFPDKQSMLYKKRDLS